MRVRKKSIEEWSELSSSSFLTSHMNDRAKYEYQQQLQKQTLLNRWIAVLRLKTTTEDWKSNYNRNIITAVSSWTCWEKWFYQSQPIRVDQNHHFGSRLTQWRNFLSLVKMSQYWMHSGNRSYRVGWRKGVVKQRCLLEWQRCSVEHVMFIFCLSHYSFY